MYETPQYSFRLTSATPCPAQIDRQILGTIHSIFIPFARNTRIAPTVHTDIGLQIPDPGHTDISPLVPPAQELSQLFLSGIRGHFRDLTDNPDGLSPLPIGSNDETFTTIRCGRQRPISVRVYTQFPRNEWWGKFLPQVFLNAFNYVCIA